MTTLEAQFIIFAKHGERKSDGTTITLIQVDFWFKQAGIIDRRVTTRDVALCFNKLKTKRISFAEFCSVSIIQSSSSYPKS
nr:unnamed protein product [Callosobruchus analis]